MERAQPARARSAGSVVQCSEQEGASWALQRSWPTQQAAALYRNQCYSACLRLTVHIQGRAESSASVRQRGGWRRVRISRQLFHSTSESRSVFNLMSQAKRRLHSHSPVSGTSFPLCDVRHARWLACTVDPCPTVPRAPTSPCRRLFEGEALLRRMYRYGFLDESQNKLDYVLALTPQDVLERRLQVRCRCRGGGRTQPGRAHP